jgi:hypothetical protein
MAELFAFRVVLNGIARDISCATGGFFAFQHAARHMPYRSRRCGAAVMIQSRKGRSTPP